MFFRNPNQAGRHKKSVKIGASLFMLTIVSYCPLVLNGNLGLVASPYLFYFIYINNFGNFFIYFWIDEKFRKFILRRK